MYYKEFDIYVYWFSLFSSYFDRTLIDVLDQEKESEKVCAF